MVVMTPRARPNSKAALAVLVLAAIILAALVDGADAAKRPPTPKKNKGKSKNKNPTYPGYLGGGGGNARVAAASASSPTVTCQCSNGAGCVRGQCKCHPGSAGQACEEMTKGWYFNSQTQKPKPCPGEFFWRCLFFVSAGRRNDDDDDDGQPPFFSLFSLSLKKNQTNTQPPQTNQTTPKTNQKQSTTTARVVLSRPTRCPRLAPRFRKPSARKRGR